MPFRTILTVLTGAESDLRVLDAALDIARPIASRIAALYADTDPDELPAAYMADGLGVYLAPEFQQTLAAQFAKRREAAGKHFADWRNRNRIDAPGTPGSGPTTCLHIELGAMPALLQDHGPLADLIVMALPENGESLALEAALFRTGRPVLAIPAVGHTTIAQTAPIAVAWKRGPESARALAASLPLLSRSTGEISVLGVGEPDEPGNLTPVVDYLAMHGIRARGRTIPDRAGGTGAILLEEAGRHGAGLLVMGAYSHSRWRELVLGGVTHHVLKYARLPVLFAH
jgi:nucleotide-binding universal stress UspA family protein